MARKINKEGLKNNLKNGKVVVREFETQFKKSLHTALIAGFGFLIALTWKELIIEIVNDLVGVSPITGRLISAIIVTLICVFGVMFVSKVLTVPEEKSD